MESCPQISLTCYVRGSVSGVTRDEVIGALQEHHETNIIDELDIKIWPDRISVTDCPADNPILSEYDRIKTWANQWNVSLEPAFARRTRTTLVSDEPETVLTLPAICLIVVIGGEIVSVVPHTNETTYTVRDALADLEVLSRDRLIEESHACLSSRPLQEGRE